MLIFFIEINVVESGDGGNKMFNTGLCIFLEITTCKLAI